MLDLTRRALLFGIPLLIGERALSQSAVLSSLASHQGSDGPRSHVDSRFTATLSRKLAELLGDEKSSRVLGKAYLEMYRGEGDVTRLLSALMAEHSDTLRSKLDPLTNQQELRDWLSGAVRKDFASGNTVMIDGWVLSRSEARLCANVFLRTNDVLA